MSTIIIIHVYCSFWVVYVSWFFRLIIFLRVKKRLCCFWETSICWFIKISTVHETILWPKWFVRTKLNDLLTSIKFIEIDLYCSEIFKLYRWNSSQFTKGWFVIHNVLLSTYNIFEVKTRLKSLEIVGLVNSLLKPTISKDFIDCNIVICNL